MRVVDDVLMGDMPNAGSRLSMIVHLERIPKYQCQDLADVVLALLRHARICRKRRHAATSTLRIIYHVMMHEV